MFFRKKARIGAAAELIGRAVTEIHRCRSDARLTQAEAQALADLENKLWDSYDTAHYIAKCVEQRVCGIEKTPQAEDRRHPDDTRITLTF